MCKKYEIQKARIARNIKCLLDNNKPGYSQIYNKDTL